MYSQEEADKMTAEVVRLENELRKYYTNQALAEFGLQGGDKILLNGIQYQLLDFDELCKHNELGRRCAYIFGYKIKKDGGISKVLQSIYIHKSDALEIIK